MHKIVHIPCSILLIDRLLLKLAGSIVSNTKYLQHLDVQFEVRNSSGTFSTRM